MNTFTEHSKQNSYQLSLPILSKSDSLNRCRERVRKSRVLSLKKCASTTLRNRGHAKQARALGNTHLKRSDFASTFHAQQKQQNQLHKGVWRGVINTFMRNGSKLRYQSVLRKALLEL